MGIAFILNHFGIRICPFFNIFRIPCPGCGLTRSLKLLFTGHVKESLQYNILGVILLVAFLIYMIFIVFGHKKDFDNFLNKHKRIFIILAVILTVIVWILNLRNPNLY